MVSARLPPWPTQTCVYHRVNHRLWKLNFRLMCGMSHVPVASVLVGRYR